MSNLWPWVRLRLPHVQRKGDPRFYCYRIYGFRPYYRLCLLDVTRTRFFTDRPPYTRVRLGRWTVYEVNREYGGLPA